MVTTVLRGEDHILECRKTLSFWDRFRGLMFAPERKAIPLVITPCNQVHTWFMEFPLRLLYLDEVGMVLKNEQLSPWRFGKKVPGAKYVVEIPISLSTPYWDSLKSGQFLKLNQ